MRYHSSRRSPLDQSVLNERLKGAISYDRIAGYFRSSLFEVAGEAINEIEGKVRIICNSDCDPMDLQTAANAQAALRKSWCAGKPEDAAPSSLPRYQALYEALVTEKIEVRVLPDEAFGLIHGKAGVVRRANGSATAFLGSVNESSSAWKMNYELLWEDDSAETVDWVQEEFDALWNDLRAVDLSICPAIFKDIKRIINRKVIEPNELSNTENIVDAAASAAVEAPVYRKEQGLWPHQKYFAQLALERHRLGGARLILADQVGLGKTVQLAMAALLMALEEPNGGPILVLAPKPLLQQWQDELMELLHLPTARWNGRMWIDENSMEYAGTSSRSLTNCPRRIGLISQGLVVRGKKEIIEQLLSIRYTCVIVDEAHRARRRKLPKVDASDADIDEKGDPNKVMEFLSRIGSQTKSMLLATATPVQLHPVEAWDLLRILSNGSEGVLGGWTSTSPWYQPSRCLKLAAGLERLPSDLNQAWEYVRDPLPARSEDRSFDKIRRNLKAKDKQWQFKPESLNDLSPAIKNVHLSSDLLPDYGLRYNPLIRCIVRRTRAYLETTINPATGEYFLPRVKVRLFGEDEDGAIPLSGYLKEAYEEAEKFSELLKKRVKGAGFFKTLLLRRLGSSMEAGRTTLRKLLNLDPEDQSDEDEDDIDEDVSDGERGNHQRESDFRNFSNDEINSLQRCLELLEEGGSRDPKLEALIRYLFEQNESGRSWLELGCILFSQYYDTVRWVGEELAKRSELNGFDIGLYAGSNRSGFWRNGQFQRCERDTIKKRVRSGELRVLLGTDAASEGLNLQRLGTLINIDLPWNPTRLEQRKGRIQRIGQARPEVWLANLRYKDSVEDRVHQLLSDRLEAIHGLFGQIPDTLEDVWVHLAMDEKAKARNLIDRTQTVQNPFDEKYARVEDSNWEECTSVINPIGIHEVMKTGW